jgi:arylsulfatase A-like enzyme
MNIVFIMSDSMRWDFLGYNGNAWIKTPCLDKLSSQSNVFSNAYINSYPTVPNRWDLLTGKLNHTYASWQPLARNEVVLAEVLAQASYSTMMIADTPHILQHGFNFQRGFDAFEWIRGQENDHWKSAPREVKLPCAAEKLRSPNYTMVHYLRNIATRAKEADHFVARTMQSACDWLEANHDQGEFFLYVDTFDPHEPWDPPQKYIDLYDPGHQGDQVTYPQYHPSCFYSEDEVKRMRALYAGEVSLVDHWIGKVVDTIERLGIRDDTAVIFTADHGFLHGEHGFMGKSYIYMDESKQYFEAVPLYDEIAHIPLLVRMPGQNERKDIGALVQSIDMMPTVLEMADVLESKVIDGKTQVQTVQCGFHQVEKWKIDVTQMHGHSLLPLINGKADRVRDFAVSALPIVHGTPRSAKVTIRDDQWVLMYCGKVIDEAKEQEAPKAESAKKTGDYKVGEQRAMLFNRKNDPKQLNDVIEANLDVAKGLHRRYLEYMRAKGTDEELLRIHKDFVLKPR